jgi:hypothetical protein
MIEGSRSIPLNTTDLETDPGGPKTYGSDGSGSVTLERGVEAEKWRGQLNEHTS